MWLSNTWQHIAESRENLNFWQQVALPHQRYWQQSCSVFSPHCLRPVLLLWMLVSSLPSTSVFPGFCFIGGNGLSIWIIAIMQGLSLIVSLVIKSLGGWRSTAISIFLAFGLYLGTRFGLSPSEPTLQLFKRLSVTLWWSNAQM